MLEHGGRLREAAARYGIPLEQWLDLSTGINPVAYPLPSVPPAAWQRLPEEDDGLEQAARLAYGVGPGASVLAVAGSQAAIQGLPQVLLRQRGAPAVGLALPCYGEYGEAWRRVGAPRVDLTPAPGNPGPLDEPDAWLAKAAENGGGAGVGVVMVGNPNNPDGRVFSRDQLIRLAEALAAREAWLVVDEAFADVDESQSLAPLAGHRLRNVVVLRSLGKFYGLAGARVGFALGATNVIAMLRDHLGPWPVSGASRAVARAALTDGAWRAATRESLLAAGRRLSLALAPLLEDAGELDGEVAQEVAQGVAQEVAHHPLFVSFTHRAGHALFEALARQGILVRLFVAGAGNAGGGLPRLRVGLPGDESGWHRLQDAVAAWANGPATPTTATTAPPAPLN